MKNRTYIALLSVGILVAASAYGSKKVPSLTLTEMTTVWIGLSVGEVYAYRIHLQSNGKGLVAITKKAQEPIVFPIADWDYSKGKIRIQGEPIGSKGKKRAPQLSGEVIGAAMTLIDRGKNWKIRVKLRRESEMLDWLGRLQQAMAPLENEK